MAEEERRAQHSWLEQKASSSAVADGDGELLSHEETRLSRWQRVNGRRHVKPVWEAISLAALTTIGFRPKAGAGQL